MPPSDWSSQWKDRLPFHPKWLLISLIVAGVAVGSYLFTGYNSGTETSVSRSVQSSRNSNTKTQLVSLPEIVNLVKADQVKSLVVQDNLITAIKADGSSVSAHKETNISTIETLKLLGTPDQLLADLPIVVEVPSSHNYSSSLWGLIALVALVGLIAYFTARNRRSNGSGTSRMPGNMGQSNARLITNDGKKDDENHLVKPQIRFPDVAGADQAKQELQEIVEFLKEPAKFTKLGARIPKGVLMSGPPGTGKTLLAKAVAGEAGVPFFTISGSEFVEMYVGVGAARVRDLFKRAREHSPCVVFVDEIDAVGRQRGASMGSGNDEREQTLNQILVEMDGFSSFTTVIVLASTNRPDILDAALLRPGRFDRKVILDRPDVHGREAILRVHTRGKPLARDIALADLARLTPGFVGADLENLVNEAAILAARRNLTVIGQPEFQDAMERIVAGPERQGKILSDYERKVIAFHEAGHALVMHNLEHSDPVHKVSIVSRGMALGYTMPLPENDRYLLSREAFEDQIVGLFGGRAAEEIIFKRITTGAANDLERATKLARAMVTRYGFSSQGLGLRCFGEEHGHQYLGKLSEVRDYSEAVAQAIDQEIRQILDHAYQRAKEILVDKERKLEELAQALLEFETIERPQFETLMT